MRCQAWIYLTTFQQIQANSWENERDIQMNSSSEIRAHNNDTEQKKVLINNLNGTEHK